MTFHRLNTPPGGALPAAYDYLNRPGDPSVGGSGVPALADGKRSGGPNDGTYLVAFGEDATSAALNRGLSALAENTDQLDDLMRRALAVPAVTQVTGAAGEQTLVIDGASAPIFCGPPGTANTADALEPFFRVTAVPWPHADKQEIRVASVSPPAALGTFFSGELTLHLEIAPAVGEVSVHHGVLGSLAESGSGRLLTAANGVAHSASRHRRAFQLLLAGLSGASVVGVEAGAYAGRDVTDAWGGGIDTDATTVEEALASIDRGLVRRRAFTRVVTDGTNSVGGDVNGPSLNAFVSDAAPLSGRVLLRRGQYTLTNAAAGENRGSLSLVGEASPRLHLNLAADLAWSGDLELDGVDLTRAHGSGFLSFAPTNRDTRVVLRNCTVDMGVLRLVAGAYQMRAVFENVRFVDGAATDVVRGVDISGYVFASFRNCVFECAQSTVFDAVSVENLYTGHVEFSGCFWICDALMNAALWVNNSAGKVSIRGCWIAALSGLRQPALSVFESHVEIRDSHVASYGGAAARVIARGEISGSNFYSDGAGRVTAGLRAASVLIANGYADSSVSFALNLRGVTVRYGAGYQDTGPGTPDAPLVLGVGFGGEDTRGVIHADGVLVAPIAAEMPAGGTIVLRGTLRRGAANVFRNITADFRNASPPASPGASPENVVRIYGERPRSCLVEHLSVIGLSNPFGTAVDRRIVHATSATIEGLSIDGFSGNSGGSLAAVGFSRELVWLSKCRVRGVQMFSEAPVLCSGASLIRIDISEVSGLALNLDEVTGDVRPSDAWVLLVTDECVLDGARILAQSENAIPLVRPARGSTVTNTFLQGGTNPGKALLECADATGGRFDNITLIATLNAAGVRLASLSSTKQNSYCATNILSMSTTTTDPADAYLNNARAATDVSGINNASRQVHF